MDRWEYANHLSSAGAGGGAEADVGRRLGQEAGRGGRRRGAEQGSTTRFTARAHYNNYVNWRPSILVTRRSWCAICDHVVTKNSWLTVEGH